MEGASRRMKREFELAVSGAWHAEAFARTKRLKKLGDYLGEKPVRKRAQSPDEMLAVFKQAAAGGAAINIRTVN